MTKQELFNLVGGGPTKVAEIFGVTKSAISQWPDPIPEARAFELRGRRPDLFEPQGAHPIDNQQRAEA